jgi:hypothetical protein
MAGKKLARNTTINGVTYDAGTVPPADVAKEITNPKAWEAEADEAAAVDTSTGEPITEKK